MVYNMFEGRKRHSGYGKWEKKANLLSGKCKKSAALRSNKTCGTKVRRQQDDGTVRWIPLFRSIQSERLMQKDRIGRLCILRNRLRGVSCRIRVKRIAKGGAEHGTDLYVRKANCSAGSAQPYQLSCQLPEFDRR